MGLFQVGKEGMKEGLGGFAVGAQTLQPILGSAELDRRDHAHGAGGLLNRNDAAYPPPQLF
jgi:poly-D-alanine transfer protein DltD